MICRRRFALSLLTINHPGLLLLRRFYIACCAVLLGVLPLVAQRGNSYLTNFPTSVYKASDQNWDAVQDSAGRMFFANLNGVLMYDGKAWKTIDIDTVTVPSVFSLDKDEQGRIFVGADNEFGYLYQAHNGRMRYASLSHKLQGTDKEFSNTWATHCIGGDVFFGSNEKLFWYHGGNIRTFYPGSSGFHTFFKVSKHLFVREFDKGFQVFDKGRLQFVKGSETFADKKVYAIIALRGSDYAVATRNDGIYILHYNEHDPASSVFEKRTSPLDAWLREKELYCGARLGPNRLAFGSLQDGLVVTDSNFVTVEKLNSGNGLQDDAVKHIFEDSNNNTWLSLNVGISFYENNTPITFWKKNDGIRGVVENVIRFKHHLYIATDKGLQAYNAASGKFEATPVIASAYALAASGGDVYTGTQENLYIGTDDGLYLFDGKRYHLVFNETVYSLLVDHDDVYMGTETSLYKGRVGHNGFDTLAKLSNIGAVRFIAVDEKGNVAAATADNGVHILKPGGKAVHLSDKQGLPKNSENRVFTYNGRICIATDDGFFEWNPADENKVGRPHDLNPFDVKTVITTARQVHEEIWFQATRPDKIKERVEEISSISQAESGTLAQKHYFARIQGASVRQFVPDSSQVYIATNQGLFCYDLALPVKTSPFSVIISRACFVNDTVNYLEDFAGESFFTSSEIPYAHNQLTVYPAATSFFGPELIEFASYLEGEEYGYHDWSNGSPLKYNNIHEGDYVFHIKARDLLGHETKELSFAFTIAPPWYRSAWAYLAYALLAIGSVVLFVRLYTRRLKQRNLNLEKVITERTSTIVLQKKELEHKNQEITDSINYAKRIQLSILPDIKAMQAQWPDLFIFYQPKDIVSGDFYWYKRISDHEFLIAIADCTGHGVPGGFMSMICSDKLHQAAELSTQPNEILFHANNYLKDALRQGNIEGGTKDGMEIALLKVNTGSREVWYSGANRFLWIVKSGSSELTEIKATKASIASTTEYDLTYQGHYLQLQNGDQLYMSSDGYPDQFGGPDGKKYMTKNFKQYILQIASLPIARQEQQLRGNINAWMDGYEQVDDLLVAGIRL